MAVAKIMDYEVEVVNVDTGNTVTANTEEQIEPQPEVVEETDTDVEVTETTEEPAKETDNDLVVLPDGRKLSPKEAEVEYRNLYSEFTRKSQLLAKHEKGNNSEINNNKENTEKEDWQPETWTEVLQKAKEEMRADLEKERNQEQEIRSKSEEFVVSQLDEIKKENPTLNENQLFNHALKYGFQDLKAAYSNMKDMQASIKKATDTTVQNIQKRNADPISGSPQSGNTADGDVYDPSVRNMSMVDYLRSIK